MISFSNSILLVDDSSANLKILTAFLEKMGYELKIALNGEKAIELVKKSPPDLILLDIMMDGIDGYETCKKIKSIDTLKDIPIIFITALNDIQSKVKAFEQGGVDFITKPLNNEEILARVQVHLKLRQQQVLLEDQAMQLIKVNLTRERFLSLIAHDIRGPIGGLFALAQHVVSNLKDISPNLFKLGSELELNAKKTLNLLNDLLSWAEIQKGEIQNEMSENNIQKEVSETLSLLETQAKNKNINLINLVSETIIGYYDKNILQTILRNLISNSIKFTGEGGLIKVSVTDWEDNKEFLLISITDTGVGIKPENVSKLFKVEEKFHTNGTKKEKGSGLGLILCKELVETQGGIIWVESQVNIGTSFFFTIPKKGNFEMVYTDENIAYSI